MTNAQAKWDNEGDLLQARLVAGLMKEDGLGYGAAVKKARELMEKKGWKLVKVGDDRIWVKPGGK